MIASASVVFAQAKADGPSARPAAAKFEAEIALAKAAVAAHGGDKLKAMQTLIVSGSVDVTTSAIAQAIPASFVTVFAGDKYRVEINNPFQPVRQVSDGVSTVSNIRGGLTLPPVNRLGFPLLPRIGDQGFVITALPDDKKKKRGFRLTSPEGYFTDFYMDPKTNLINGYDSTYEIRGRTVSTSVEVDKYRLVEGIQVPERYAQRFDTEQMTVYADFKAKDISINSPVEDAVFRLDDQR